MQKKISIIGGGSWGTALAQLLAGTGLEILVYVRDPEVKKGINRRQVNPRYFPDIKLSEKIKATENFKQAINFSSWIMLAVPTAATREVMKQIAVFLDSRKVIISTAKGLENDTFLRNSEIISEYTSASTAVLSGPTHSEEVIKELPTAAVIAAADTGVAEKIQQMFRPTCLRLYANPDVIGVELGGAVKNIIAVAAGIGDGLNYGDNSRASLITRGLAEMSRLGEYMGGRPETFSGLAGLGDLVVTCNSMHSRNRRFGINVGKGYSKEEALKKVGQAVEGVFTTKALYERVCKGDIDVEIPITRQVYQVLFENKDPRQAVNQLMQRKPKYEIGHK